MLVGDGFDARGAPFDVLGGLLIGHGGDVASLGFFRISRDNGHCLVVDCREAHRVAAVHQFIVRLADVARELSLLLITDLKKAMLHHSDHLLITDA